MKNITSKLIHGNIDNQKDIYRSLKTPIYETNAYSFDSSEQISSAFKGEIDAFAYSRTANPTVFELENRLTLMADAVGTVCVSSGMFAITSTILALCNAGDHIVASTYLFGHSYALLNNTLRDIGIETTFVNPANEEELTNAIKPNTKIIFLENIANPQLFVFDIDKIAAIAKKHQIILMIDNTLLTPYLFSCADHGVDVEILSTTKSISGGATSFGGAIISYESDKWGANKKTSEYFKNFGKLALIKKLRKDSYRNTGGSMSPHNAYLQLLGLETLTLRMDKSCENALAISRFLETRQEVKQVNYPALPSSKYFTLLNTHYKGKAGCLVNFELESKEKCFSFMNKLKMIRRATNFCDNKSLIIHPHSTIYAEYSELEKQNMNISDCMIRFSVGIEDIEDIKADILQAM
ncbi:MAG: O-acetylhomoserine aminocarboxypropyltransferase/cysteine synthase [Bacteroidales bacterium]|nr:O-acetylhomoserine aminocarboxypropyltransferase/cysteine synthase [Bacteroidales bacterium]